MNDKNNMKEEKGRVFVTGVGGRFPGSDSMKDWWKKLCNGTDLVTPCCADADDEDYDKPTIDTATTTANDIDTGKVRYPDKDFFDLPNRMGQIKDINKFDNMFFGISASKADSLDPQIRMLL